MVPSSTTKRQEASIAQQPLSIFARTSTKVGLCALGVLCGLAATLCFFLHVNMIATYALSGCAGASFLAASIAGMLACRAKPPEKKPPILQETSKGTSNQNRKTTVRLDQTNARKVIVSTEGSQITLTNDSPIVCSRIWGKEILTVDESFTIKFWDRQSGRLLRKGEAKAPSRKKFGIMRGKYLVWADAKLYIRDIQTCGRTFSTSCSLPLLKGPVRDFSIFGDQVLITHEDYSKTLIVCDRMFSV